MFNGHLNWDDPTAPDADMPKAAHNPACGGTAMAEKVDMERAWHCASLRDRTALYLRFGMDMTLSAVAEELGAPRTTVIDRIEADVTDLTEAINRGRDPQTRLGLRPCGLVRRGRYRWKNKRGPFELGSAAEWGVGVG